MHSKDRVISILCFFNAIKGLLSHLKMIKQRKPQTAYYPLLKIFELIVHIRKQKTNLNNTNRSDSTHHYTEQPIS